MSIFGSRTIARAMEIMKIKKQTMEEIESKKAHQEIKELTLKEKQQKIQEIKTLQEDKLNKSKIEHLSNSVTIAKNTKESLQTLREKYKQQKEEMMKNNMANVQVIQDLHKNAINRKKEIIVD